MKKEDIETLMRAVSTVVKDLKAENDKTVAMLLSRIEVAEKKVAAPGRDGERGESGTDGRDGRDGMPGVPGRDAAQLEVLDGIDPKKTYQRGACASYRGGLIKAFRATDALGADGQLEKSGWQVLMNGIAEEEESQFDGGRLIQRTTTYTNGQRSVRTHRRQVPIYRKIYESGKAYEGGDVVTYGGSLWICGASSPTKLSPGAGSDSPVWTLCVKRGKP